MLSIVSVAYVLLYLAIGCLVVYTSTAAYCVVLPFISYSLLVGTCITALSEAAVKLVIRYIWRNKHVIIEKIKAYFHHVVRAVEIFGTIFVVISLVVLFTRLFALVILSVVMFASLTNTFSDPPELSDVDQLESTEIIG